MSDIPTPAPAKPKLPVEQSLVLGVLGARARGKKAYDKAGAYLEKLMSIVKPGKVITLGDGRRFAVVDTFADQRYAKKMTIIDRFALQEVK